MSTALIVVDIQHDFMPGGALAVPAGDEVVPVINQLIAQFDCVVATQDWHPPGHVSFASSQPGRAPFDLIDLHGFEQVLWPDHCIQGTRGAELVASVNSGCFTRVFRKGQDPAIDSYSGFFDNDHRHATGLGDYLRDRGVNRLYLTGLAEDVCVLFTAMDARRLGFEVYLVQDATRSVEAQAGDGQRARQRMREAGVQMIDSSQLAGEEFC